MILSLVLDPQIGRSLCSFSTLRHSRNGREPRCRTIFHSGSTEVISRAPQTGQT